MRTKTFGYILNHHKRFPIFASLSLLRVFVFIECVLGGMEGSAAGSSSSSERELSSTKDE